MDNKLVSIIIPVYNRESIIQDTIESAINQSYPNIEVIIVDNCSKDTTYEICCDYQRKDPRIRVYRNDENIGPVRNWLECLKYSSGDYIKFLWSDDWIDKDFVEKTIPYLDDRDVAFAYSSTNIVTEYDNVLSYKISESDQIFPAAIFIKQAILGGNVPVSPGCAVFRRSDIVDNLLIDIPNQDGLDFSRFGAGNDLLLFLLPLLKYKKVAYLNSTKSYFRHHAGSLTVSNKLALYYDWAKLYFLTLKMDPKMLSQFKSLIWLRRLKDKNYSNILNEIEFPIDISFLVRKNFSSLLRRLKIRHNH